MQTFLDWLVARAKERSSWLGLTGLITAVGVALSPDQVEAIVTVGTAIAGAIALFTKDKAPPA